jgi:hypothetical protein
VENVSCDKFTVVWDTPAPSGLCTVIVQSANQSPQYLLTQGQRMEVNASPNTVYQIQVSYICNRGTNIEIVTSSVVEVRTPECPPPCPELRIAVNDVKCDRASISWNTIPSVDYSVVYHVKGNSANAVTFMTSAPVAVLSNLSASQTYEVTVSYLCQGRRVSKTIEITTPSCPPSCPPLQPRVENVSCDKFTVVWDTPAPSGLCTVIVQSANQSPQYLLTQGQRMEVNASPNTVYQIQVSYICNRGTNIEIVTSSVVEVRTPECPPPCPELRIAVNDVKCDRASISWNTIPSVDYSVVYHVKGNSANAVTFMTSAPVAVLSNLSASQTYEVTVSYLCQGRRVSKTIEITTPSCPPSCPPLQPRVENVSCDKFTVVWDTPAPSGLCTVIVQSANQSPQYLLTQGQRMEVNASPNTVYQIQVSYICNRGTNIEIVTSSVVEVRTPECPPPPCLPIRPRVENVSCDKFTVVWDTPAPSGLCTVIVQSANQSPQYLLTQGQRMEVNASPNTVYQIQVSYICNRGANIEIVTSSVVEVRTPECPRPCPRLSIRPVTVACQNATLAWEPLPGVNSYTVRVQAINDTAATEFTVNGNFAQLSLRPSTSYLITVSYICNGEAINAPLQIRTPECPPSCSPLRLSPVQLRCDSVIFSWNSAGPNAVYDVSLRKANEPIGLSFSVISTNVKLPVQPSTAYRIEVGYLCNGQWVVSSFNFTTPACQASCNRLSFRIDSLSCRGARINWTGATVNVMAYNVIVRKANTTTVRNFTTSSSSIYVGGLEENSSYRAEVIYICNGQRIISFVDFNTPACSSRNKQSIGAFNSFNIYPNPSKGWVNITYESSEDVTLNVINMNGQVVGVYKLEAQESNGMATINLTDLPKGVYMLRFSGNSVGSMHKLVIN